MQTLIAILFSYMAIADSVQIKIAQITAWFCTAVFRMHTCADHVNPGPTDYFVQPGY